MKRLTLIALIVLATTLASITAQAQETCWRIVNGKGAGFIVSGNGGFITNSIFGSEEGSIALGHFTDCECTEHSGHYHGTLGGIPDPDPEGCGWGCVDRIPCDINEALNDVVDAIDEIDQIAPGLGDKLIMILDAGSEALSNECYSVLLGDASAFGDELLGARANQQVTDDQIDNLLDAFMAWVNKAADGMTNLPVATNNPCCKISLVLRKGSGPRTKFFDAKRKINADLGEVIVLDIDACPKDAPVSWEYQFKGEAKGDVAPGTGISFSPQRFCVVGERATSVKVTVTLKCPDGKEVKDTVTINYQ
jgi:hypothetical protein